MAYLVKNSLLSLSHKFWKNCFKNLAWNFHWSVYRYIHLHDPTLFSFHILVLLLITVLLYNLHDIWVGFLTLSCQQMDLISLLTRISRMWIWQESSSSSLSISRSFSCDSTWNKMEWLNFLPIIWEWSYRVVSHGEALTGAFFLVLSPRGDKRGSISC